MSFPVLLGDVLRQSALVRSGFAFQTWAKANRFDYPVPALEFLSNCGSAAEAYFAREFCQRPGVEFTPEFPALAETNDYAMTLQVRAGTYRVDAVVSTITARLAVEIDGMAYHHRTAEQLAADYLRQRRIVCKGFTVIRFTAKEVFATPAECWRQVEIILGNRGNS